MEIENLTLKELREIAALVGHPQGKKFPVEVGKAYLFRTVTNYTAGEVDTIVGDFATLKNAAWIADTGRFHNFLVTGTAKEVEPYPNGCCVNLTTVVDLFPWTHSTKWVQK